MGNKIPKRTQQTYNEQQLRSDIGELVNYYEPINLNAAYHQYKLIAAKKLHHIVRNHPRQQLQTENPKETLRCAYALIYYFGMRLKIMHLKSKWFLWNEKRQFNQVETIFQMTLQKLLPELSRYCIKEALNIMTEVELWPFESFVADILNVVLYYSNGDILLFNLMLSDIHYHLFENIVTARHRMRVMYELLNNDNFHLDSVKLLPFITRLLNFFAHSVDRGDTKVSGYRYLKTGFDASIRRIYDRADNEQKLQIIITILNWLSMVNMNDESISELSLLLMYTAKRYITRNYEEALDRGLLTLILEKLIGSHNHLNSYIGCRLLRNFLDRHNNSQYFCVPTIFYSFSQVDLIVGEINSTDKLFIRNHREELHDYILRGFMTHCQKTGNVCALYSLVCVLLVEVPCGLTAASTACLMMAVQEFALTADNLASRSRYWIHAVVISVMSLICFIHKAPVLYQYVKNIVSRRANEAPQLNPPLMQRYDQYYQKVTLYKASMYFEDWELRYGLWKHFQARKPQVIDNKVDDTFKKPKKLPSLEVA